jgi:DNA-binding PadR family transcriptional regulator
MSLTDISGRYIDAGVSAAAALARKPRENRTRYVVLGMLTTRPLTGYGLRKAIEGSVGHFWQESYGQLYPTLRRLAEEGLVEARATRGGPGRGGATYRITERGRAVLASWVALPPVLEPERNELLLKVFFAGSVPPEVTLRNLDAVGAALRQQQAELEGVAARIAARPPKELHPDAPYWQLTLDFGLAFMKTALDWLDRAEAVVRARKKRNHR